MNREAILDVLEKNSRIDLADLALMLGESEAAVAKEVADMEKVLYLDDYRAGVHSYYPELGERKPEVKMEASLGYYGTHYYVDTPLDLKGRGITPLDASWVPGCQKEVEGWKSYRVTKKAFEKLKAEYPIAMERLLD